jgi:hypothetical protein
VYDFVEFSNPNKDQWFQIGNVKTRRDGRNYASEHILEWESFLLFLHNDKGKTNKENELKNSNKKQGDVSDDDREDPELCRTL